MRIGYARTSTTGQIAGLDAQLRDLKAMDCQKIFSEQLSSVDAARPQLAAALAYAREGDVLIVTKLDRLARSMSDLVRIEAELSEKGVALIVLSPAMDTATPAGRLIFNVLGSIAQFEREIMLERQREGIAKAKSEGKYKGRKPIADSKRADVLTLRAEGVGASDIARRVGVSLRSVYNILQENQ